MSTKSTFFMPDKFSFPKCNTNSEKKKDPTIDQASGKGRIQINSLRQKITPAFVWLLQ